MEKTRGIAERIAAQWTDDCQGKKDFDGAIIGVSSRYWPRGGSFLLIDREAGTMTDSSAPERQHIKPHAHSSIQLHFSDVHDDVGSNYRSLIEKTFEAETQEEVQAHVEAWAQRQFERIRIALDVEFSKGDI